MEKYVNILINSKKIDNFVNKLCRDQGRLDLKEDLFNFCILQLLEKDLARINIIDIEYYFMGIVENQMKSDTSEFYKQYRNSGFTRKFLRMSNEPFEVEYVDTGKNKMDLIEESLETDYLLNRIDRAILSCHPLKIDMFKMKYYEDKTYKEIAEYYNIHISSVKYRISSVKKQVIDILEQRYCFKTTLRSQTRRINAGKLLITDKMKLDICKKYKNGATKKDLSNEYELSYPTMLKLIKQNINRI